MTSTRKQFTLAAKIKFLDDFEKKPPSMSMRKFCEANDLNEATLRGITRNKEKLLVGPSNRQSKRKREGHHGELEENLHRNTAQKMMFYL